jgi:pimeloyl-ACP methyl ester carboxylesterase
MNLVNIFLRKRTIAYLFILIGGICTYCSNPGDKIEYGSNNGEYVTLYNTKVYYEEYGQGTPLLLLQGGGITRSIKDFSMTIPELSKSYRVIVPDTPGQGRSELADSLSYDLLTGYTSLFIDSLKLDSVYVIGFSDGAIVGLLLAEQRPNKIKKVIAVGANNGIRAVLPPGVDPSAVQPYPMDEWEKRNKAEIETYVKTLPRDWKKLINDQNAMWYQHLYFPDSTLARITIPVMIAQGDRDDIRLEHGVELHRLIPNSQFCALPNTTHDVFAERPALINNIALDFFGRGTEK